METTHKIIVVITAYNEENNIIDCIESAQKLTNNIFVVDTESTDKTAEYAKRQGVKVLSFPFSKYVEPARKFAVEKADADWVLILDADEGITDNLAREIKTIIENTDKTHFSLPRKNIFAGIKWLKHGGWYPDYVLRLIKKDAFVDWPSQIHSYPTIRGGKGYLQNPLIHYFHPSLENMVAKTAIFEDIEAELLFKAGKKTGVPTFFRKYFGELYRRILKNVGFADGAFGIIESMYQAFSKTITYVMLYEKKKSTNL